MPMTLEADRTVETLPGRRLGFGLRCWLRIKHSVRLAREVSRFSSEHRVWWLLPLVLVLVLFAVAVTTTTTALPVAVYTLF